MMARPKISSLAATIAALTEGERSQLLSLVRVRTALGAAGRTPTASDEALYTAVTAELSRALQYTATRYGSFRSRSPQAKEFAEAVKVVDTYLAMSNSGAPMTILERTSAYGLVAELVVRDVRRNQNSPLPLWRRVCTSLKNINLLVERAFPGYAESGLLSQVYQFRRSGNEQHE